VSCGKSFQDGEYCVLWQFPHWGHVNINVSLMSADGKIVHNVTIPSSLGRTTPYVIPVSSEVYHSVSLCETTFLPSSRCAHCSISGRWLSQISNLTLNGIVFYFKLSNSSL